MNCKNNFTFDEILHPNRKWSTTGNFSIGTLTIESISKFGFDLIIKLELLSKLDA